MRHIKRILGLNRTGITYQPGDNIALSLLILAGAMIVLSLTITLLR